MIKNFGKSIGIILLYFFVSYILQFLYLLTGIKDSTLSIIAVVIIEIISTSVVVFLLKNKIINNIKGFKENYKDKLKITFKYWFVGFLLMIASNLIIYYLIKGNIAPNEAANRDILLRFPVYSIFSMCILAPITEELLFRLNFKDCLKSRYRYAIVTGVMFGFMHILLDFSIDNLIYLVPYSILGIAFGLIFYDTDNIGYSTLAHAFHNSLSVLVIFTNI